MEGLPSKAAKPEERSSIRGVSGQVKVEKERLEKSKQDNNFGTEGVLESLVRIIMEGLVKNSTGLSGQGGNSAATGISELEQMLKQKTFTRSETEHLIALLNSRTINESRSDTVAERDGPKPPRSSLSPLLRLEASTSESLENHKPRDEMDNFHAAVVRSRALEEEIASPAELAKAYKGSTIGKLQVLKQHPATMENLPGELLTNIFIRLLAKQLAQMRSVSKSWNALLSQSSFVKSHLDRSIHNSDQILLVFYENVSSSNYKPFTTHLCRSPHLKLNNFIKLPVNSESQYTISVIGAVNGLICSSYGDSVIHIWNPSLSAVLTLPPYSMPSSSLVYDSTENYFRFGFDPKTDDYKVIKLTGLIGPSLLPGAFGTLTNIIRWCLQVEIYSMRKGSWELINERFPSHITRIFDLDSSCVDGHDGHLHWLGISIYISEMIYSQTIVAFDLGLESFREISLPNSIQSHQQSNHVGVLARKLCVMSWAMDGACEVWVMEEYGVADSWTKRHVFSQFVGDITSYGSTSHGKFLIEDSKHRLVLYDPIANKAKIFKNYNSRRGGVRGDKIVEYVDSLVWVAPEEHMR